MHNFDIVVVSFDFVVIKTFLILVLFQASLISSPVMVNGLMMNVSSVIFTLEVGDIGKIVHTSVSI